eukprot:sb/3464602/
MTGSGNYNMSVIPVSDPITTEEDGGKVEEELSRVAQQWEKIRMREEELKRKEETLQKRDQLMSEIDQLKAKEMRTSQYTVQTLIDFRPFTSIYRAKPIPPRPRLLTSGILNRLLKDSLGGNSQTLMITCVSPAGDSFEETLNSLKYAKRARRIQNTPIVNKDVVEVEMQRMESEILLLREQLKTRENSSNSDLSSQTDSVQEMKNEVDVYRRLLSSAHGRIETCIRKGSVAGLDKVLTGITTHLQGDSTNVSDEEDPFPVVRSNDPRVAELQEQVEQLKEDLANDEKIFAEQQFEFDQTKSTLNDRVVQLQHEVAALRQELAEIKSGGGDQLNSTLNATLKKEKVVITRTTPCTMDVISSLIRKKTFSILDRNIRNAISPPSNIMTTTQVIKQPTGPICTREDHQKLEEQINRLKERVSHQQKLNTPDPLPTSHVRISSPNPPFIYMINNH